METVIGLVLAAAVLVGLVFVAKRFIKPVEGPLPGCCGGRGAGEQGAGPGDSRRKA